jgi:hypothetical protein
MKEFKRYFSLLTILSFCAVLIAGSWFFWSKKLTHTQKSEQFIQERNGINRLLENSSEIQRVWQEGEESKEWSLLKNECLKYFKITTPFDETILRCHPMILQCLDKFSKKRNYHFVSPNFQLGEKKIYRYITKSTISHLDIDQSGYLFTIEDNESHQRLNLLLADQCHEVFLQNRTYAYGEEAPSNEQDYRFDNFTQNIYLDKHLVMNSEINEWIEFGNPEFTRGLVKKESDDLFLPATHLTMTQMMNYCSFRGKQLLLAHYFDAAAFMPQDLNEVNPLKSTRSPYYWTKKKSEYRSDCQLLYANDCMSKNIFQLNSTSPTWAGLMDSMGGVFEAFRNPIDPESNLKASSMYFNFKSPWHKLGFRAGWDGEGFDLRHFDFKGINPSITTDKFQVGFRCMRESK